MFIEVKSQILCWYAVLQKIPTHQLTNLPNNCDQTNKKKLAQVYFFFPHCRTFLFNWNTSRLFKWHWLPCRVTRAFRINEKKQAPSKAWPHPKINHARMHGHMHYWFQKSIIWCYIFQRLYFFFFLPGFCTENSFWNYFPAERRRQPFKNNKVKIRNLSI